MVLSVRQVLEAVAELEEASLELVCWELNVHVDEARPAFERAIADGLLARRRIDEVHDESCTSSPARADAHSRRRDMADAGSRGISRERVLARPRGRGRGPRVLTAGAVG